MTTEGAVIDARSVRDSIVTSDMVVSIGRRKRGGADVAHDVELPVFDAKLGGKSLRISSRVSRTRQFLLKTWCCWVLPSGRWVKLSRLDQDVGGGRHASLAARLIPIERDDVGAVKQRRVVDLSVVDRSPHRTSGNIFQQTDIYIHDGGGRASCPLSGAHRVCRASAR